jgi:hypothetical protein
MDAAQELRRAVPRVVTVPSAEPMARSDRRTPTAGGGDEQQPLPNPAVELAEVLHDAVDDGIFDAEDAKLIARSRIGGDRVADLAAHRGLRPRTLWDRRQRAELALVTAHRAS